MKKVLLPILAIALVLSLAIPMAAIVFADPGDLLGTVDLPGNGDCSVAGTFDCTYYMTMEGGFDCDGSTLQVYLPPAGGNGNATLVSTKTIVDKRNGDPVSISALAYDSTRDKVWGAYNDSVWLIDIGDRTVSGNVAADYQFACGVGGIALVDGLAWDPNDDTLFYSPDVNLNVYHFATDGTLLNTVTPKNAAGQADGLVSGVVVGSDDTLYIARNGASEIRRIDKITGAFISNFATTYDRVEDLTCDPVTYAPDEAILAKDAYNGLYEAFEVEAGTCPCLYPPPAVGGYLYPMSEAGDGNANPLLWLGVGLASIFAIGGGVLGLRRLRVH